MQYPSKKMLTFKLTLSAIYTALALLTFMLENLFPPIFIFAPSVRLGISNTFIFLAVITLNEGWASLILIVKCLLSSIITGNMFAIVYSLTAGLTSLLVTSLCYRFLFRWLSVIAISVISSCVHNVVQFIVASLVVNSFLIMSYVPFVLIASILAGIFNGFLVWLLVKKVPRKFFVLE